MFLSEFSESKIELVGHILVIDGKRYINRGLWLIGGIDVENRTVYKEGQIQTGNVLFTDEGIPFDEVNLIPLFGTRKR